MEQLDLEALLYNINHDQAKKPDIILETPIAGAVQKAVAEMLQHQQCDLESGDASDHDPNCNPSPDELSYTEYIALIDLH